MIKYSGSWIANFQDDGLLGHGDEEGQFAPKLVAGLEGRRVVQVAAGNAHSLFLRGRARPRGAWP